MFIYRQAGGRGDDMQLLICLMGYQCSGIKNIENYLITEYGLEKYKSFTTRKRYPKEDPQAYHFVNHDSLLKSEKDFIAIRNIENKLYGKLIDDLPENISVCIVDYLGYRDLSKHIETLPIFVERPLCDRFDVCEYRGITNKEDFLFRDKLDSYQFDLVHEDEDVSRITFGDFSDTLIAIDDIIFPYIKNIELSNKKKKTP